MYVVLCQWEKCYVLYQQICELHNEKKRTTTPRVMNWGYDFYSLKTVSRKENILCKVVQRCLPSVWSILNFRKHFGQQDVGNTNPVQDFELFESKLVWVLLMFLFAPHSFGSALITEWAAVITTENYNETALTPNCSAMGEANKANSLWMMF